MATVFRIVDVILKEHLYVTTIRKKKREEHRDKERERDMRLMDGF